MRNRIAIAVFGLFLLSASAFAKSTGQNFQFYVTDNRSGEGIHAATVEVNGMTVCITTKGFCEKVLEYSNGVSVTIVVIADEYLKKKINMNLTSDEPNLIGLNKPSRGRESALASPGFMLAESYTASTPVQGPDGREILIDFTVVVQDVAGARIPRAKVTVTDERGVTKTLTTDNRNGTCRFQKLKQGRMRISVTAQGFVDGSAKPAVVNGQQVPITLYLPEK